MYHGFNMLVGDGIDLYQYSNREDHVQKLEPGIYGMSNYLFDAPWPKVKRGKALLQNLLEDRSMPDPEALFTLLQDRVFPPDDQLPDTGVGLYLEFIFSPIFVTS